MIDLQIQSYLPYRHLSRKLPQDDVAIGMTPINSRPGRPAFEVSNSLGVSNQTRNVKMVRRSAGSVAAALTVSLTLFVTGCGTVSIPKLPDIDDMFGEKSSLRETEQHRQNYQSTRDPDDLRWILANRISSGMSVTEVGRFIGEEGRRIHDDNWIKKGGGHYQSGDKAWKWEQDRNGQSLILVFREGRLVNFDPSAYAEQADPFSF
ncbi:MAG: hypothetical protein ACI93T_001551 [Porticoccaceae bacterium]|jgi:hypothetical protein